MTRITGTLHGDQYTRITSRSVILRMRVVSDNSCRESQNTRCMFNNYFPQTAPLYDIMWKNMVERARPRTTIKQGARALHAE